MDQNKPEYVYPIDEIPLPIANKIKNKKQIVVYPRLCIDESTINVDAIILDASDIDEENQIFQIIEHRPIENSSQSIPRNNISDNENSQPNYEYHERYYTTMMFHTDFQRMKRRLYCKLTLLMILCLFFIGLIIYAVIYDINLHR